MAKITEPTVEQYTACKAITDQIDKLLYIVDRETAIFSNPRKITEHPGFAELVLMGDRIVPYLFHVMTERGCTWVILRLLGELVPENPIQEEHRGNFYGIIHDWLGWYLRSESRLNSNIYYGLVG